MPYLLAAVLTNLCYALADNANGLVAKRNGPLKVAWWSAAIGAVIFVVPLVLFFQSDLARLNLYSSVWIIITGAIVAVGYWTFITGMHKGSITVTGVIGGSFPAITALTALIFFHESISWWQALAIAIIVLGICLSSIASSLTHFWVELKSSSIIFALVTMLLWGVYYALVRIPIEQVGWFLPQYGSNIIALPLFWAISRFTREPGIASRPQGLWLIIAATVLQIGGSILYDYALTQGPTSVIAPIAGSSPAVFAILALFIFREKLGSYQKIGIITTILGIVVLSVVS